MCDELASVLAQYVERYGLTDEAKAAFLKLEKNYPNNSEPAITSSPCHVELRPFADLG